MKTPVFSHPVDLARAQSPPISRSNHAALSKFSRLGWRRNRLIDGDGPFDLVVLDFAGAADLVALKTLGFHGEILPVLDEVERSKEWTRGFQGPVSGVEGPGESPFC